MKIRIYETDFEGNPVECTGVFFREDSSGYRQCYENEPVSGLSDSAGVHAMDACKYRAGKVRPS